MKRKIKRLELILGAVWLIIIVSVVGASAVHTTAVKLSQLDKEISLTERKFVRQKAVLKQETELNAEYDRVWAGYKAIKDSDSLLQAIDGIARRLNVNIIKITPQPPKAEAGVKTYPIKIEGQDDIYAIAKFLNALTDQVKSVRIDSLQVIGQNRNELPKESILINAAVFE